VPAVPVQEPVQEDADDDEDEEDDGDERLGDSEDDSDEEIARKMDRGVGAVRMLWVRALARLREIAGDAAILVDADGQLTVGHT
jgi:hypothetical protein